jgi:hypothetical protein
MEILREIGPSYQELKPLQKMATWEKFPVYHDLTDRLLLADEHPNDVVRHLLSVLSGYAYSSTGTVAPIAARMGLERNHCLRVSEVNDAMLISSHAYLLQSSDGRVAVLAYRGSEPSNLYSVLTDTDVVPEKVAFPFDHTGVGFGVHAGFYRNIRSTRHVILDALRRAMDGRSILADVGSTNGAWLDLPNEGRMDNNLQALYITGHSLGGAMAAILAIMLATEPLSEPVEETGYIRLRECLRAVYTFGQPMVGDSSLARAASDNDVLRRRVVRFVYGHDPVPHLPSKEVVGDFAHFGQEYQSAGDGAGAMWIPREKPSERMGSLRGVAESIVAPAARNLRILRGLPFAYSLYDHMPQQYIIASTPPGRPSEFGDYKYEVKRG